MGDRPVGADGERPRAGHGSREGLGGSGAEEVFAAGKGGLGREGQSRVCGVGVTEEDAGEVVK